MVKEGQLVGPYRLLRKLGAGTFGEVWLSRHEDLGSLFAVKFPTDPDYVKQLRAEGNLVFRLRHPMIVCFDHIDTMHDPPYLVTEYVQGETLRRQLDARSRLRPDEVVDVLGQVLEALRYAHGLGFVHGDLKPENILLTDDGRAKLLDFGLGGPQSQLVRTLLMSGSMSTASGVSLRGTYEYLSPERRQGEAPCAADDLYAAGILAYELLVGVRPLPGIAVEGALRRVGADCFAAVISKALDIRGRRHSNASEMLQELCEADKSNSALQSACRRLSWRSRDLHKAMVACCTFGMHRYRDEVRATLPRIELDEHFAFVLAAFAAGCQRDNAAFNENVELYAIDPLSSGRRFAPGIQELVEWAEGMKDTLIDTSVTDSAAGANEIRTCQSTEATLLHFVRGLIIFAQWHNSGAQLPDEVNESLAEYDPYDASFSGAERAILCAINATHVAGHNRGDLERYLLRNAVKDLACQRVERARDKLAFMLHIQGYKGPPHEYRVNPKVLIFQAVASAFAGDLHGLDEALSHLVTREPSVRDHAEALRTIALAASG